MARTEIILKKLPHTAAELSAEPLRYSFGEVPLNDLLGQPIRFSFAGHIECLNCGRKIKKTFGDGYCFVCSQKLAAADLCILRPERCHFRHGTCREPEWAKTNCLVPHVIYLANTSGLKVGITREHKKFERWGDQGATSAIVLARVPERYISGIVEVELAKLSQDKTDWRALITGKSVAVDLLAAKAQMRAGFPADFTAHFLEGGDWDGVFEFRYPVQEYPAKALSLSFDKQAEISGTLQGIRGQYVFVDGKAVNMRKHSGYRIALEY